MRRVAFIADIHSNLEALEAVLARIESDETYCLGDVVGYGASPNQVIEVLKENEILCIAGNHDRAVSTGDTSGFNARAAMAAIWTRRQLQPSSLAFLEGLPLERKLGFDGVRVHMAHGSPDDQLWEYVDPATHSLVFARYLDRVGADALALAHTHIPYVWKNGGRLVFNPGSVGQPRDGDRRASFATLVSGDGDVRVDNVRVEYDCEKAAAKIRESGLPDQLASRLLVGA
ncbi:MAG TPA: metallophosphoesterase family protein [Nitrososphaerales archaeon]|nr:metallophosphoesterase family protein [Nitrososphaerales archaeon]